MRILIAGLAAAAFATAAAAAEPQPTKTFTAAADFAALIAKDEALQKAGQPTPSQPLVRLAPYTAAMEYRTAVGPAAVHEDEAEFFYVLEGSGVLTTGGKLVGETRMNPTNLSGTGVEGGETRKVAKGDVFIVPEKVPHWFSTIDGRLVMISMHVPRK